MAAFNGVFKKFFKCAPYRDRKRLLDWYRGLLNSIRCLSLEVVLQTSKMRCRDSLED